MQAFPILYLNLTGELVYIIEQRLQAQNIPTDKSLKVLNDILSTILNRQFINDIFRSSQLSTPLATKALMEKIAHASIMRLNEDSMNKLYDLMTMAVKYQFFTAPEPSNLFDITKNHLNSWIYISEDPETVLQIEHVKALLTTNYSKLSPWVWMTIRHSLLNFLQPNKTRVTIFLKLGLQNNFGYYHLELNRTLPQLFTAPDLVSRKKIPYDFLQQVNEDALVLGSNLFNDVKRPIQTTTGGLNMLQQMLTKPSKTTNEDNKVVNEPESKTEDKNTPSSNWESVHLQLKVESHPLNREEPLKFVEESLLDLYDQAGLTEEGINT